MTLPLFPLNQSQRLWSLRQLQQPYHLRKHQSDQIQSESDQRSVLEVQKES